jgi:hypothetical protein
MMGQVEVFEYLVNKRSAGDHSYFLPKEIEKGLRDQGLTNGALCNIRGDCFKLWQQGNGCLEMFDADHKGITNWLKGFRVKKVYCRVVCYERVKG